MTHDEGIQHLLNDPALAEVARDNYLGPDLLEAAQRFSSSAEFAEVAALLGDVSGSIVLDVGAGNGIASYAFARSGAVVYAIEPDDSPLVGRRAMRTIVHGARIHLIAAIGEALPLPDACIDILYLRATLHHVRDLDRFFAECARVLRSGGKLLACREHVAENERELESFKVSHPLHRLAGGEHAYPVGVYVNAIRRSGLQVEKVLGPWDSVINAFPSVQSNAELHDLVGTKLRRRLGPLGRLAFLFRPLEPLFAMWVRRPRPGRLYSFLAVKP